MSAEGRTQAGEVEASSIHSIPLTAEAVLIGHLYRESTAAKAAHCSCGMWLLGNAAHTFQAHLADAVTAWIGARLAEVREDVAASVYGQYQECEGTARDAADAALGVVAAALGATGGVEGDLRGEQGGSGLLGVRGGEGL